MHQVIHPRIHCDGTPVVPVSTLNEDGSANLAPMLSAWWLGQSCMLGRSTRGKTFRNPEREGELVLNLASVDLVDAVDRLALTTGCDPVPAQNCIDADRWKPLIMNLLEFYSLGPSVQASRLAAVF